MLFVNWSMLLSCIVCIPVSVYVTKKLANPTYNTMDKFWDKMDEVSQVAKDTVSNHKIEKAYNLKHFRRKKFDKNMDEATAYYVEYERLVAKASPFSYILNSAPTLICIMVGFINSYFGVITSGEFVSFVMLLSNISKPLSQFIYNVTAYKEAQVSIDRVLEILDMEEEESGTYVPENDVCREAFAYQIKNVTFSYEENIVLDNLNCDIKSGQMTAFVGESGSGKSTLFKLLAGFYQADTGSIDMYGHNIADWNKESLRSNIACVEQSTYLFNGTIADNIRAGRIEATDEEVIEAAKLACAYEFIVQMPDGFNTVLTEGGNNLSGGQKQRVSIARAFVKNAPILLLDEITSALDSVSEKMIQQALDNYRKDKTVVIIAHRLSTIAGADKICVMDKGRLLEEGTHKELLSAGGLYSQLCLKNEGGAENA